MFHNDSVYVQVLDVQGMQWDMNTDINAVFALLLEVKDSHADDPKVLACCPCLCENSIAPGILHRHAA